MTIYMVKIQCKLQDQFCDIETFTPLLEGCLYSLDWPLSWPLNFFFLSMINIAVVLLAKVNLGVLGK